MARQRRADFDATRRTMLTLLPTIGGLDAERLVTDLDWSLGRLGSEVRVAKTRDPARRIEASMAFTGSAPGFGRRLLRAVREGLPAGMHERHRITIADGRVVLEFVSWVEGAHQCAGHIEARRLGAPSESAPPNPLD